MKAALMGITFLILALGVAYVHDWIQGRQMQQPLDKEEYLYITEDSQIWHAYQNTPQGIKIVCDWQIPVGTLMTVTNRLTSGSVICPDCEQKMRVKENVEQYGSQWFKKRVKI
jgi:hypothetical protein